MLARIRKSAEEKDQGFTLIELLVVIIIIGILAAIAIPVFLNQRKKGWDSAVKSDLKNAATAQETYLTEKSYYTLTEADLLAAGFKPSSDANYATSFAASFNIDKVRDAAGNTVAAGGATAVGSYCMSGVSRSSATFYYDSAVGGLTTTAC